MGGKGGEVALPKGETEEVTSVWHFPEMVSARPSKGAAFASCVTADFFHENYVFINNKGTS